MSLGDDMRFQDACARLAELFEAGEASEQTRHSSATDIGAARFQRRLTHTREELREVERTLGITFPSAYHDLLVAVGSARLYIDPWGTGVDLIAPGQLRSFAADYFAGFADDPFPELVLVVSLPALGCVGGFLAAPAGEEPAFAVFHPDEDPTTWVADAARCSFAEWVVQLVESDGQRLLV